MDAKRLTSIPFPIGAESGVFRSNGGVVEFDCWALYWVDEGAWKWPLNWEKGPPPSDDAVVGVVEFDVEESAIALTKICQ